MAGENSHSWTEGPCFHLKYSWSWASVEHSSLPSNATCASLLFSHFAKWLYLYLSSLSTHICPTPFTRFLPLADDLPDTLWRKQKPLEEFSHLPTNKPTNWPTSLSVFFSLLSRWKGKSVPESQLPCLLNHFAPADLPLLLHHHFSFLLEVSLDSYSFNIPYFPTISKSWILILSASWVYPFLFILVTSSLYESPFPLT